MKLQEVLPKMSKMYLTRIVDSFLKDVKFTSEEEMREVVIKNIVEFQNEDRVKRNLNFIEAERNIGVLDELILICLMETGGYIATYTKLLEDIETLETEIVNESQDDDYILFAIPEFAAKIYNPVLTAAWKKDESLNAHEKNILEVLRKQLNLTKRHHRLLESRIGRFPQKGNKPHTNKQIDDALKDLQTRGILLRFKTDDIYFVIPDEIARVVRYELGGELRTAIYETLLENLHVNQLKQILTSFNLHSSGTKNTLVERITKFNILPSKALDSFSSSEMTDILRTLDGAKVSGTKEDKIQNIIDYYENISSPSTSDSTDERARYYDFFEELASRDYKSLRVNKIINKDVEVEHYYEEATRYLFEKKMGLELMEMTGSKHADGRLKHNSKEVVLWDNKSTEKSYHFPEEHFEQFLGYIRADSMRPTLFLVITYDYTPEAVAQAQKLKAYSEQDTDVALITAADLKFVAEEWKTYSGKKEPEFNLQVFNLTGELDRNTLMGRMSWALG